MKKRSWLRRHLDDPYVALSRQKNYRSRSAFKLSHLNQRFKLFTSGQNILDLGAAPGGWCQIVLERSVPNVLIAVDRSPIQPLQGVNFIQGDILDPEIVTAIKQALPRADIVLSDLSPSTTGHRSTDALRSIELAQSAFSLAQDLLTPEGLFLCKIFRGNGETEFVAVLKQRFERVKYVKPTASRQESREIYLLAAGLNLFQNLTRDEPRQRTLIA